jgi:hypothetical protein
MPRRAITGRIPRARRGGRRRGGELDGNLGSGQLRRRHHLRRARPLPQGAQSRRPGIGGDRPDHRRLRQRSRSLRQPRAGLVGPCRHPSAAGPARGAGQGQGLGGHRLGGGSRGLGEVDAATRRRRRAALVRLRRRLLGPQPPRCSSSRHGTRTPPCNQASTCWFGSPTGSACCCGCWTYRRSPWRPPRAPAGGDAAGLAGGPLPAGPALDRVPNALRWGALWFSVIRTGPRDGAPDRLQVLPGRWPEAPSWRGSTAA